MMAALAFFGDPCTGSDPAGRPQKSMRRPTPAVVRSFVLTGGKVGDRIAADELLGRE
jgi:hypothetical protein